MCEVRKVRGKYQTCVICIMLLLLYCTNSVISGAILMYSVFHWQVNEESVVCIDPPLEIKVT